MPTAIRQYLNSLVDKAYVVDIEEMAKSLNLSIENDKLQIEDINVFSPYELGELMLKCLSWKEYVNTRRIIIKSLVNAKEQEYSKMVAEAKMAFMESVEFARGSKGLADLHVEGRKDLLELRKKISNYEVYAEYLYSLEELLNSVHYAVKTLVSTSGNSKI